MTQFNKKLFFFIAIFLCLSFSLFAYEGRIGAEIEYTRYSNRDMNEINAQGGLFSIIGASYFDDKSIFGLEYSFGYGYNAGNLQGYDLYDLSLLALFNFDLNHFSEIELGAGIVEDIYVFNNIVSNQFGLGFSLSLIFKPIEQLALSIGIDYVMPMLAGYGDTVKDISLDNHLFRYGLSVSYIY